MTLAALALVAFLVGSIAFAVIVSRLFGLPDPRSYGSGNPGATNVLRTGRKAAAALTLAGDAAKGWLAVFGARHLSPDNTDMAIAVAAVAVVLGHMYSVFLRLKGGKGVATAVGQDGTLQLYVTNITDPSGLFGSNLGNTFFMNEQDSNGIRFRNVAAQYGVLDTAWGWGTAFVDMNLDGAPDLYAVQGMQAFVGDDSEHLATATSTLFLGDAAGTGFSVAKDTGCDLPGDQRALVVFDYDRDGSPDLLITQVAGPTVLLQNYTSGKHWLTVAPEGPSDAGIGARVTVTAGGRTMTQIVLAGGSYLAGPPREAYFGLDAAPIAESVRVDWANGTTTELHDVTADQILRVAPP
jgi:hypothetical protein